MNHVVSLHPSFDTSFDTPRNAYANWKRHIIYSNDMSAIINGCIKQKIQLKKPAEAASACLSESIFLHIILTIKVFCCTFID